MKSTTDWLHHSTTMCIELVLKSVEANPHLAVALFGDQGGNRQHRTRRTNRCTQSE